MKKYDILVLGAGIAGLSTSYHLAKKSRKKILLLEWEKEIGGHASGRNAGMIRQTVSDPFIARLAVEGRKILEKCRQSSWRQMAYQKSGSLLLGHGPEASEIEAIRQNMNRLGVRVFSLSKKQIKFKVPLLKEVFYEASLFCPSDALLDIRGLLSGFFTEAKNLGVSVKKGIRINSITKTKSGFCVAADGLKAAAEVLVNACGAWSGFVPEFFKTDPIHLTPYRRHLYWTSALGMNTGRWPFVWDLSADFYFRPDGKKLLLSPCDKMPVNRSYCRRREEKIDPEILLSLRKKLKMILPEISDIRIVRQKSGLRTMAPDGRFVIGEDAKIKNFYWVGGLGGHGVTTCFSTGDLASDIILGRNADSELLRVFSPARFK